MLFAKSQRRLLLPGGSETSSNQYLLAIPVVIVRPNALTRSSARFSTTGLEVTAILSSHYRTRALYRHEVDQCYGAVAAFEACFQNQRVRPIAPGDRQSRVAFGRALSPGWLHRDEHEPPGRARRYFLQQARDVRAMDQGRQRRDQVDAAIVPDLCRKRGAASASCARLQPRQFPAHAGDAGTYE